MQENKTFKGMQNENTALKQDYQNLMKDFVEACKSERKANDVIQKLVIEFLMPQLKTNVRPESDNSLCTELENNVRPQSDNSLCTELKPMSDLSRTILCVQNSKTNVRPQSDNSLCAELETNVGPQSDNSLCAESGSFWHGKYKEACEQITKLLQSKDFAMGDLNAEIEFRQKAEAENLVLKGKIDVLENDLETEKSQVKIHEKMSKALYDNLEKDYAKIEMQKLNLKKEHVSDNSEDYFIVYERTKSGEMSSIGGLIDIAEAKKLAKDSHESEPDKSHYVFKKVLVLTPETNKK